MTGKISRFAGFSVFCLLFAAYRVLGAVLTNGVLSLSALSTYSGGNMAANGVVAVNAANIGGLTDSSAPMINGSLTLTTGGTPAMVTFGTWKNDLSGAHCYPVPFKPSAGHTKITFTNLTRFARIRIYTISGELVRTLDKTDTSDKLVWNVRNARGSAVDSGVYLYLIESAVEAKKGKLMIIR